MKLYLATGNENKKREMKQILETPDSSITIVIPKDEGIAFDPEETGTTFHENSLIKAKALWNIVHCPVIADDSGICVDALGGAPGVYSSRYAGPQFMKGKASGEKIPQQDQNRMLIEQLNDAVSKGIDIEKGKAAGLYKNGPRSAHYTCSMVFYFGYDKFVIAEETMEGTILERVEDQRGTGGFGYDPLFFLPSYGKTAAELTADEKNKISHRGKATRIITGILKNVEKL
ncbi:MAG: RdgB/HAM1 family non-canonical purine NTP pyrophosphatase [Treponema sp.]|nr:RdgB/HAM1 family non-canonical purine NTP pyrophosphatase [Treponema sp.]